MNIVNSIGDRLNQGHTLVIGYGNTLRGDDGVGYHIAMTIQQWEHPQLAGYPCQQLTPDLAALLQDYDTVVFVDAAIAPANWAQCVSSGSEVVQWQAVASTPPSSSMTHAASPAGLLGLAQWLYNASPVAYLVTIPTRHFDFTEALSPTAIAGKNSVLAQFRHWYTTAIPLAAAQRR